MKFLVDTWYLFVVALISGVLLVWPLLRRGAHMGAVSCAQAIALINRERAAVLDVRSASDFAAGHIINAKNVPLEGVESGSGLPKNKAVPVILICASGARGSRAVQALRQKGYVNAYTLMGGISAWREANLPLEK